MIRPARCDSVGLLRFALPGFVAWGACGCSGPLGIPMVMRLEDEKQAQVTETWDAMLTPADRVERTLLLDTILAGQLHQTGVDELEFTSRKYTTEGMVVMEVRFARENPELDEFTFEYFDYDGNELRRERFQFDEVDERVRYLTASPMIESRIWVEEGEELPALAAERNARFEEIKALLAPMQDDPELPFENSEGDAP